MARVVRRIVDASPLILLGKIARLDLLRVGGPEVDGNSVRPCKNRRQGDATMKVIELGPRRPSLEEVIVIARNELVVLRQPDGSVFAVSQVDDFDLEVELLRAPKITWWSAHWQ